MQEQAPIPKNTLETGIDTASVEVKIADLESKKAKILKTIELEESLLKNPEIEDVEKKKILVRIDELLFKLSAIKKTLNELGGDLDFTAKPAELIDDDTARRLEEAGRQGL